MHQRRDEEKLDPLATQALPVSLAGEQCRAVDATSEQYVLRPTIASLSLEYSPSHLIWILYPSSILSGQPRCVVSGCYATGPNEAGRLCGPSEALVRSWNAMILVLIRTNEQGQCHLIMRNSVPGQILGSVYGPTFGKIRVCGPGGRLLCTIEQMLQWGGKPQRSCREYTLFYADDCPDGSNY